MGHNRVKQEDLMESVEVILAGYQRKGAVISPEEKKIIAYHEVGHALVAAKQKNSAPCRRLRYSQNQRCTGLYLAGG